MISLFGNILQIAAMLLNIAAVIAVFNFSYLCCRRLFYLGSISLISSFLLLIYSFVTSDFSLQNVFLNSSTVKPLIFKIAGAWASHEGSILLWLCLLSIVSCAYIYLSNNINGFNIHQITILSSLQIIFCSFIYMTSNPFNKLSFTPAEGLGLNPTLQDIALAIHPPILYFGYICYVVPFTASIIILIAAMTKSCLKLEFESLLNNQLSLIKAFSNYGMLAMTCGIGLGSWWAYRELGWGGYWFFDPVENISLMPWLSGIALHHTILITIKSERLLYWSLLLSIITFLLVVLGLFLVRSGIIISIHSFASSSERGIYLLSIFALIALPATSLLVLYSKKSINDNSLSFREIGIILANMIWLISLTILLISIIFPVIYFLYYQELFSVDYKFFTKNFIPVIACTIFLAVIFSGKKNHKNHLIILLIAISITCLTTFKVHHTVISALVSIGSLALILHMINLLLVQSKYFTKMPSEKIMSMILSHAGFGLLALAITFNSLMQKETDFIGKIGDDVSFKNFNVALHDVRFAKSDNYYRQIAEFWVKDIKNNNIIILKPENRLYFIEKTLSQESDIYSYLTYDLYAVLSQINDDNIHAKIYYRPLISFIWLSLGMICSGLLLNSLTSRSKHSFLV